MVRVKVCHRCLSPNLGDGGENVGSGALEGMGSGAFEGRSTVASVLRGSGAFEGISSGWEIDAL